MTIEWGTAADWASAIGNLVVAGAAVGAARQGIKSLSAWRTETIGRRKIELAEEVLTDFYEARDILSWVRSPMSYTHEAEDRPGREAEAAGERQGRDTYYVPIKRLSDNSEFFGRLRARRYRVIATFGQDAAAPYEQLWRVHTEIAVAARALMRNVGRHHRAEHADRQAAREQQYEETIWEDYGEPDALKARVEAIVQAVEVRFRAEISQPT